MREVSLLAHSRDAHGPHAKGKAHKQRKDAMPAHVKDGRTVVSFGTSKPEPPPIMEIDFITPDSSIRCLGCGLMGAIPLTCYCPACDPLAQILQADAETRPLRQVHWGFEPWASAAEHNSVLLLPRPANSDVPEKAKPSTSERAAFRNESIIPAFLRRDPQLTLEQHEHK